MPERFVPLGRQGVGRVRDHGGRLARILDQIRRERAECRDEKVSKPAKTDNERADRDA